MPGNKRGENNTGGSTGSNLYSNGEGYATELARQGDKLGEEAKLKRRIYAAHYIKHLNKTAAAAFAGFKSPDVKGVKLFKEPYVQGLIHSLLDDLDFDAIMSQNEVLFQLKTEALAIEAGNQGARVSALAHISKIHGMLIDRQEIKTDTSGGVLLVPGMVDPGTWSEMAEKVQATLKETVKD